MQTPEFPCILETSHSHVLWRAAIPSFNRSAGQRLNLQSSASIWITDEFYGGSSTIYQLRKMLLVGLVIRVAKINHVESWPKKKCDWFSG